MASIAFTGAIEAQTVTVQILVTTDLHGYLLPWDYSTGKEAPYGLGRLATLIQQERAKNPRTILVDNGDTIQGSMMESLYQLWRQRGTLPKGLSGEPPAIDPMIAAMNALGFEALTAGNHEFNYGLKNLDEVRRASKFPWLSANTLGGGFQSHIVREFDGIRIAIIGVTTPAIPQWEKPEHISGLSWEPQHDAVRRVMKDLKADAVIVLSHSGLERDTRRDAAPEFENGVARIAWECPNVDAILFGHTHRETAGDKINEVILLQPKNWGVSLGKLTLTFENGKLTRRQAEILKPAPDTPIHPDVARIAQPYHELTEQYLKLPVAESAMAVLGRDSQFVDSVLVDAVQRVQLHYSGADVSLAALFNTRAALPKGQVTVREIAALYPFENELYAIEGNGRMLRLALENSARFFNTCSDSDCSSPLVSRDMPGYNFDLAQGVSYEIDLRRQPGQRIRNLVFRGRPLEDEQPLRIAINNYRYGGSGGYDMFQGAKIVYRSGREIRDLIIDYYSENPLLAAPDHNWRILPESALRQLRP